MKSGFIELVINKALAGAPKVRQAKKAARYKPIDSFKKYLLETLPSMEQRIQIQILKKNLLKIKNASVRTELINSYLRRLFRIRSYEKDELKSYKQISTVQPQSVDTIINPIIIKTINQVTEYDIGSFILLTQLDMNKVFKHGSFGRYTKEQYLHTRKFGIQIRQQSLALTNLMRIIQRNKDKKIDWEQIKNMTLEEKMNYINEQENYPPLFMELNRHLFQKIQQYKPNEEYNRIWGSSIISDTIINSILQSQAGLNNPIKILNEVIQEIMTINPPPSSNDFFKRFKTLPGNDEIQTKNTLPENVSYFSQSPSLQSIFLGGEGGSGKSMILTHLAMYAHKNKWIVVNVPDCRKWTHERKKVTRFYNGLYLQNEAAVQWLDQFLRANDVILNEKPVDMQLLGKYDITGIHDDEYEPVPNLYYEDRNTYFDEISVKYSQKVPERDRKQAKMRIMDVCKQPKSIFQIGQAGIANPEYATCAMAEILGQIYQLDTPILECVDAYSWLYRPSGHPSFRYFNDKGLYGRVPPYHIAHCRLFVHLDGHKYRNGLKVVASSNYPLYKHKFDIKQMMLPSYYEHKVRNLDPDEFEKAGSYNILSGWWQADQIQRTYIAYSYVLTQGNWGDFQELMRVGHYF